MMNVSLTMLRWWRWEYVTPSREATRLPGPQTTTVRLRVIDRLMRLCFGSACDIGNKVGDGLYNGGASKINGDGDGDLAENDDKATLEPLSWRWTGVLFYILRTKHRGGGHPMSGLGTSTRGN